MKFFKLAVSMAAVVILVGTLQVRFGKIPPIGKFLDPVNGFWANAETAKAKAKGSDEVQLKGLSAAVTVKYDNYAVPHIFASSDNDLYFAQGYITAKDRLWQMDIQVRTASGRLSEILGKAGLEKDLYNRRLGLPDAAGKTIGEMLKDPQLKIIIESYCAGVNAYIQELTPREYPIEYKILDYTPEAYKPVNCALVLKLLSETLSGGSDDIAMTNTLKHLGGAATKDLFPDQPLRKEPVIPAGTVWDFEPLKLNLPFKNVYAEATTHAAKTGKPVTDGIGSNNWAVSGSRSANGFPLLANDPHLKLTFPSVWYQLQLAAGEMNTYGVSIPGTPCIIVGYNHAVAWGVTNVQADVMDWYRIKFKDATRQEYWYQNHWNPVRRKVEKIEVRNGPAIYDTILYTHHGPVRTGIEVGGDTLLQATLGYAFRWIAAEPSEEIKTFYLLNKSKNYADYKEAISHFSAPAQNFIFASNDNDIAITSQGRFPLRYTDQGKFILDGTDSADDWHGWIPAAENPSVKNPARGFLSSANQVLTDSTYPYYISWQFGSSERAKRINSRLEQMQRVSVDSLRLLQNDNYSIIAEELLGMMMKQLDATKLTASQKDQWQVLSQWNRNFDANTTGATIFSLWWAELYKAIWDDDFQRNNKDAELRLPARDRTVSMIINEPDAVWYDNTKTPKKETLTDLINLSYIAAVGKLNSQYGPGTKNKEWGRTRNSFIEHLGGVTAFGSGNLFTGGSASCVNAMSQNFGPSWRMIIQLGPRPKAFGIYPGGESGNPGSFYYDNFLETWQEGKLLEFIFLSTPADAPSSVQSTLILKK